MDLNLAQPLLPQLSQMLGGRIEGSSMDFSSPLGAGRIRCSQLPGGVLLNELRFRLNTSQTFSAKNPADSPFTILNINLSKHGVEKTINEAAFDMVTTGEAGVLLYGPEAILVNPVPAATPFHLVQLCIPDSLFDVYDDGSFDAVKRSAGDVIFERLSPPAELCLRRAIAPSTSRGEAHAEVLSFLSLLTTRLKRRGGTHTVQRIHPADVEGLLKVANHLRENPQQPITRTERLAALAGMSSSKFKVLFKQFFGHTPGGYHRSNSLGLARKAMRETGFSVSEMSAQLGYADVAKFSRAYKAQFGVSPSQDRLSG